MSLMEQIAVNAAHFAVDNFGHHLTGKEKAEMWQQHYDTAYAAIMTWDEASSASRFRATSLILEN